MVLDRITLTGADDTVSPTDVVALWREFPFSEWGILFSKGGNSWAHGTRFPSRRWVSTLLAIAPPEMKLCAHLCDEWVGDIVAWGVMGFDRSFPVMSQRFQRVQLNFHEEPIPFNPYLSVALLGMHREFIFQVDGVNDSTIREWCDKKIGSPLFDVSGGAGVLPEEWPDPWPGTNCGYAGGLGPGNIELEYFNIMAGVEAYDPSTKIWLDMETKLRSGRRLQQFDLDKCREVLSTMAGHIEKAAA